VIQINNLRAIEKDSMVAINLHGDGIQGKRFNRGFTLVAAKETRWVFGTPEGVIFYHRLC